MSSLDKPLMGDDSWKGTNEGTWTLSKLGIYSGVQGTSEYLDSIVSTVADNYNMSAEAKNAIVIHELTDGGTHVAYGVMLAYDSEKGYAVFLGDGWDPRGACYLLSNSERSEGLTITVEAIATDFSQTAT